MCDQTFGIYFLKGESEGYTVITKEKDIAISDYPLLQTEFLYASKKGKAYTSLVQQCCSSMVHVT